MHASVLLVHTDRTVLSKLMGLLTQEGYEVATATSFKEAQASLLSIRPDLLVAAVRLGAFNGIGLALRAQLNQTKLAVVITDETHDVVLEREAVRLGASYVVNPFKNPAFLSNVNMTLSARGEVHPALGATHRASIDAGSQARTAETGPPT
jgi:two-component system nitrogen regulation response regulator NtrX